MGRKNSETILFRRKVQLSMTIFVRQSQRSLSRIFLSESLNTKMNDIQCYRRRPTEKLLALWLFLGKLYFFKLISIMASILKVSVVNPKVTTVIKPLKRLVHAVYDVLQIVKNFCLLVYARRHV